MAFFQHIKSIAKIIRNPACMSIILVELSVGYCSGSARKQKKKQRKNCEECRHSSKFKKLDTMWVRFWNFFFSALMHSLFSFLQWNCTWQNFVGSFCKTLRLISRTSQNFLGNINPFAFPISSFETWQLICLSLHLKYIKRADFHGKWVIIWRIAFRAC